MSRRRSLGQIHPRSQVADGSEFVMAQIHYLPDGEKAESEAGETILNVALRSGIPHAHACGGKARCSTCRVMIVEGVEHCGERSALEEQLANRLRFGPQIRLACQPCVTGDVTVRRLILDDEDLEISRQLTSATGPVSIGEEKKIAILFADIRGFTRFAERLPPYDVIYVLNRFFYDMNRVISPHGGCIHNCMGDGLMALFGVEDASEPALRAVRAGLDMLEAVGKLKPYLQSVYQMTFEIGVGVHFGEVIVGSVGGEVTKRITAIGDGVNLASRIEAANKECGTRFLVSEGTYLEVQPFVRVGQQFHKGLKGKRGKYRLYEIIGLHHLRVDL